MISGQSLTCPKGASLTFEIDMDTGSDLTGATAQWALCESWFDQAKVYLTKTGTGDGLFIGQDAGVWKITVNLAPTDTLDIPSGLLYHDCKVLLQSGDVEDVANGPFSLDPSVNKLLTNAPITRNLHAVQLLGRLGQNAPLTVAWLARNLLATQNLVSLGQSAAGTVTSGGVSPAFSADFTALTSLLSWMSFSRASNAMVFDSTGKLTYAPNNLLLQSNTFTDAAWTPRGTTVSGGVSDPIGGSNAFTITSTSTNSDIYSSPIFTEASKNYITSIWARRRTGTGPIRLMPPSMSAFQDISVTSSWTQIFLVGPGADSNSFCDIQVATSGDAIDVYSAVYSLVTYETTPRTADQVITTSVAYYGPRFDFAWNGSAWVATGLLIEEQRTNNLFNSNTFSSTWSASGFASVGSSGNVSPDGTTNATTLTVTASTSSCISQGINSGTVSAPNRFSLWARVTSGTGKTYLAVQGASTGWGAGETQLACNLTTSWQRFALASANPTDQVSIGNTVTSSDASASIEIFGAQLDAGPFVTSYIPTTTAAVTRSADIVQLTGTAATAAIATTASVIAEVSDRPDTDQATRFVGSSSGGTALAVSGGKITLYNLTVPISSLVLTWPGTHRGAVSYDSTGISLSADGGAVVTSSDTHSSGMIDAYLGSDGGTNFLNGHFRSLAIYTVRISDADLQTKSVVGASL